MGICSVLVPVGALGGGIENDAFQRGMARRPDIIAVDAGSTDSGPFYLGAGKTKYSRKALKDDIRQMLIGGHQQSIPVAIGSCGTCGTDSGVDLYEEICKEIMQEEGFTSKIVKIYTQQQPEVLKKKYEEGKIHPLPGAPVIDADTFASCSNIVALAGVEPFIKALEMGADIVLCGRATDTAILASYPLIKGVDPAVAWHAAKLAECAGVCTTRVDGCVLLEFEKDSVVVEATAEGNSCTVYSVSSHMLYENADPIHLIEPGVYVDTTDAVYEQLDGGRVRVSGSKYEKRPYTMKLEGSRHAGYQTITLVGVRDRKIMRQPMDWLNGLEKATRLKLEKYGFDRNSFSYSLRPYGWNAVYGGEVPEGYVPNELGVLLTVTADSQELATQVAKTFNPALLHYKLEAEKPMPSFAFPFSPAEIERGPFYEFVLNHVVDVDDPMELVRIVAD